MEEIKEQYDRETGRRSFLFHGSSPGSSALGVLRLENVEAD
jgi:hypothetical protein